MHVIFRDLSIVHGANNFGVLRLNDILWQDTQDEVTGKEKVMQPKFFSSTRISKKFFDMASSCFLEWNDTATSIGPSTLSRFIEIELGGEAKLRQFLPQLDEMMAVANSFGRRSDWGIGQGAGGIGRESLARFLAIMDITGTF